MTARTKGYVEGVKRQTGSVSRKTAEGAIATHVGASNDNGIAVEGTVKALTTISDVLAEARIVVNGKTLASLAYHRDGTVSMLDMMPSPEVVKVLY